MPDATVQVRIADMEPFSQCIRGTVEAAHRFRQLDADTEAALPEAAREGIAALTRALAGLNGVPAHRGGATLLPEPPLTVQGSVILELPEPGPMFKAGAPMAGWAWSVYEVTGDGGTQLMLRVTEVTLYISMNDIVIADIERMTDCHGDPLPADWQPCGACGRPAAPSATKCPGYGTAPR